MELLKTQLLGEEGSQRKGHVGDCSDSAGCNDFGGFEMGFKNQHAHDDQISVELRKKLELLLARDMYVYNFAKRLFEARFYSSKTNVYTVVLLEFRIFGKMSVLVEIGILKSWLGCFRSLWIVKIIIFGLCIMAGDKWLSHFCLREISIILTFLQYHLAR